MARHGRQGQGPGHVNVEIPLHASLAVVALVQAIVFALVAIASRWRATPVRVLLVIVLVLLGLMKLDQLFQLLEFGTGAFAVIVGSTQWLITPALFLLITARAEPDFRFDRRHLLHAMPFVGFTLLGLAVLVGGPALAAGTHPIFNGLPFYFAGVVFQLTYLVASWRVLRRQGLALRHWYSRTADREVVWPQRLVLLWIVVLLAHVALNLGRASGASSATIEVGMISLNLLHIMLVNGLFLVGIDDVLASSGRAQVVPRYQHSNQSPQERVELFGRIDQAVDAGKLYLNPDLSVADLSDHVPASPREVSEAINAESGKSFSEYINAKRIGMAQQRLQSDPALRIIDVAMDSGFNSKSAFNNAFKRQTGTTPSAFRRQPAATR